MAVIWADISAFGPRPHPRFHTLREKGGCRSLLVNLYCPSHVRVCASVCVYVYLFLFPLSLLSWFHPFILITLFFFFTLIFSDILLFLSLLLHFSSFSFYLSLAILLFRTFITLSLPLVLSIYLSLSIYLTLSLSLNVRHVDEPPTPALPASRYWRLMHRWLAL